ncbi:hypothetical protein LOCC1_G001087 [Lachnellula occidentalis]|uniref:Uncharacterized protein n=1 Tax=Lachnellula occidentalis TaxID=215460 RepID=A0A8H8S679_9HELO|nr:hypothetical protein LOCC1_G001087 [Lachnellula occidentalis]
MTEHKIHTQPRDIQPCVILFNGFPGVGKLSSTKGFQAALHASHIPSHILDNHTLIDPVSAIHPLRTPAHYALRKTIRKAAFEHLKALDHGVVILMTTCLAATAADIEVFAEHVEIASARGIPLININITCDFATNRERLCCEERRHSGKSKLLDVEILTTLRQEHVLLDASAHLPELQGVDIKQWSLDSSALSVEDAVQAVFDLFVE